MAKIRNLDAGFRVKNFSYTYSLFKGNHSMESKIIEYRIILLHKYKVEQTEVISRLLFTFLLTNYKNVWSDTGENIYIFLIHFDTSFTVTISRAQEI